MNKIHRIITGITLLVVFGFILVVWANGRSAPPPTFAGTDTVKAVQLRLTFATGDSATVTQVEGGVIRVEKEGKKLSITPYLRDHGQVELRVFQAVQRQGGETMEAVDTLMVDQRVTELKRGNLPFSVRVLNAEKNLPAAAVAVSGAMCCASTCAGTLVCGFCVCTDCGRCGPNWCDCAQP